MFYRKYIEEALKITWGLVYQAVRSSVSPPEESSAISRLVYEIFGGEILKTPVKNGWHFYNRIDGEFIDFTKSTINDFPEWAQYANLSSSPGETNIFFSEEDYTSFFTRFVSSYEEVVRLSGHKMIA